MVRDLSSFHNYPKDNYEQNDKNANAGETTDFSDKLSKIREYLERPSDFAQNSQSSLDNTKENHYFTSKSEENLLKNNQQTSHDFADRNETYKDTLPETRPIAPQNSKNNEQEEKPFLSEDSADPYHPLPFLGKNFYQQEAQFNNRPHNTDSEPLENTNQAIMEELFSENSFKNPENPKASFNSPFYKNTMNFNPHATSSSANTADRERPTNFQQTPNAESAYDPFQDLYQSIYENNVDDPDADFFISEILKQPFTEESSYQGEPQQNASNSLHRQETDFALYQKAYFDAQQEKLENKLADLERFLMTEYRDRQIKHKHLLQLLDKNAEAIDAVDEKAEALKEQQENGFFDKFEALFFHKIKEVMERSENAIIKTNAHYTQRLVEDFQNLSQNMENIHNVLGGYGQNQKNHELRLSDIENKINFLAKQQILQQKMHAKSLKAQKAMLYAFAVQSKKTRSRAQMHAQPSQTQSPFVQTEQKKAPQSAAFIHPLDKQHANVEEETLYRRSNSSQPQSEYDNSIHEKIQNPALVKKKYNEKDLEKVLNTMQTHNGNVPKSWQDALSQLFRKAPLEKTVQQEDLHRPFNAQASARIIEQARKHKVI